jgi:hypothetical protein
MQGLSEKAEITMIRYEDKNHGREIPPLSNSFESFENYDIFV